jgi:trehalose 6-phosphate phosphatase
MNDHDLPLALESLPRIREAIGRRKPAFFLDFDGTLAPLASSPDLAQMLPETRGILASLARNHLVCVISGRDLADLCAKVGLESVYYAADHGHRVLGPPGSGIDFEVGPEDRHELEAAAFELERRLRDLGGVVMETKGVSLSVHYRMVAEADRPFVRGVVEEVVEAAPGLKLMEGKLVHEVRPDMLWGKGRAALWLLKRLQMGKRDVCPICVGDDLTDEEMFAVARNWGVTVVVGDPGRPTWADYLLRDCQEMANFLRASLPGTGQTYPSRV